VIQLAGVAVERGWRRCLGWGVGRAVGRCRGAEVMGKKVVMVWLWSARNLFASRTLCWRTGPLRLIHDRTAVGDSCRCTRTDSR
jgi:hypothetical protein